MKLNLALQAYSISDPIVSHLKNLEVNKGVEYWNFGNTLKRVGAHSLISYPAMMVPPLQSHLIDIIGVEKGVTNVLDPFVGSGTIMVESMMKGLNFTGIDINPLAGLSCLVKSGPYFTKSIKNKVVTISLAIQTDRTNYTVRHFFGVTKWFNPKTAYELELICNHIRKEKCLWARRIYWLALSRTVRSVSNSRLSTYKLHKREEDQLNIYRNAVDAFITALDIVVNGLEEQRKNLLSNNVISQQGHYKYKSRTIIGDANKILGKSKDRFDLIMTSPPYGDNRTTIPYGQFSYLPLHWIDLDDISKDIDATLLESTQAIDGASLGGSLRGTEVKLEKIVASYPSAKKFADKIINNKNGLQRFSSFFCDLEKTVERLSKVTANSGYHSWTVGDRRIDNITVPMCDILTEMLDANGIEPIARIGRQIKNKKMAPRNRSAQTMGYESILIGRNKNMNNDSIGIINE